jgi:hypothetical protein
MQHTNRASLFENHGQKGKEEEEAEDWLFSSLRFSFIYIHEKKENEEIARKQKA